MVNKSKRWKIPSGMGGVFSVTRSGKTRTFEDGTLREEVRVTNPGWQQTLWVPPHSIMEDGAGYEVSYGGKGWHTLDSREVEDIVTSYPDPQGIRDRLNSGQIVTFGTSKIRKVK